VDVDSRRSATPARVFVPFLVPVPMRGERSRPWWRRVLGRARRIFAVASMLLGFYSALAGLHWAPAPPGLFPIAKAKRPASGGQDDAGMPGAKPNLQ
jgi:hypothetical protein